MGRLKKSCVYAPLFMLLLGSSAAWAQAKVTGSDGPGGGELTTSATGAKEIDGGDLSAAQSSQRAITRSGCIAPFSVVTYSNINLPGFRSFLHRVVPDRRGFNVVMRVIYPRLNVVVNRYGPGRTETYTVNTPNGATRGRVQIYGVGGSYGCYTFRITP